MKSLTILGLQYFSELKCCELQLQYTTKRPCCQEVFIKNFFSTHHARVLKDGKTCVLLPRLQSCNILLPFCNLTGSCAFCPLGYKSVTIFYKMLQRENPAAMYVSGRAFAAAIDYRLCVFLQIEDYRLSRCLPR